MNVCLDCSFTDLLNLMANFVIIIFLVKQVLKTFLGCSFDISKVSSLIMDPCFKKFNKTSMWA
jgi:hypothetical protein